MPLWAAVAISMVFGLGVIWGLVTAGFIYFDLDDFAEASVRATKWVLGVLGIIVVILLIVWGFIAMWSNVQVGA